MADKGKTKNEKSKKDYHYGYCDFCNTISNYARE